MKNYFKFTIVFLVSVFSISFCNARSGDDDIKDSDVPMVIKVALKSKFSGIYVYDWEYNKKPEYYRAKFVFKGDQYKVYFKPDGTIIKTEQKLIIGQLPSTIMDAFATSKYSTWEVKETRKVTQATVTYILKIKRDKNRELTYDAVGELITDEKD